ncbi:MAG TPA: peptidoglycan-associated lipoprotein Pal [Thermoanaerobaculia bacterium]|nr:peptidoglycan-associated lipoprotein Pal [Thermoanaerobaculia bacterium]
MSSRSRIGQLAAIAAAVVLFAGCRHARTVPAPVVAPQAAAVTPAPVPETKVAPPSSDFVSPKADNDGVGTDPLQATELADQKGWIRDAFYDFNSSTITPSSETNLDATSKWLRDHRRFDVLIEGHCDERGTEQYNLALGERRAWSAKEYLAARGIDPATMKVISYGKEKPFDDGHDEDAWAKNRRAHVALTSAK